MIRTYIRPYGSTREAYKINMETGEVLHYFINDNAKISNICYPFSFYHTSFSKMGYTSTANMIKELKRRKYLGVEVDTCRQTAEEISALLHLAKFRASKDFNLFDIEDKLINIYGLSEEYTSKILRYITKHDIERHTITVIKSDGDGFTTEINGTPAEIENYYNDRVVFIA